MWGLPYFRQFSALSGLVTFRQLTMSTVSLAVRPCNRSNPKEASVPYHSSDLLNVCACSTESSLEMASMLVKLESGS